ncbi:uncharacterized protein G2W53_002930 [Senna tora]|uniref:Uncharacterized protein n=1 Tax=Senna tora TaxID=362788 RepID=A0A835CIS1_9FABA|nr:uncharacterized protein G2W53_002930 [Senna tora]
MKVTIAGIKDSNRWGKESTLATHLPPSE